MKKIIMLILVVALCAATFASCNLFKGDDTPTTNEPVTNEPVTNEPTDLEKVAEMYKNSAPTKVTASTKQTISSSLVLECSYELVNGKVGDAAASVYTEKKQELETVETGGGTEVIKPLVKETTRVTEAIDGVGSRLNGGTWNTQGTVSTIAPGGMSIKLNADNLKNVKYENNTLTFTVPKDKVASVFGKSYATNIVSDVKVTIVDNGAEITSIELSYNLAGDEDANLPASKMVVKVEYTYDLEVITIS